MAFGPFVPPNLLQRLSRTEQSLGLGPQTNQAPTLAQTIAQQNATAQPLSQQQLSFPGSRQNAQGGAQGAAQGNKFFQFLDSAAGQALLTGLEGTLGALGQPEQFQNVPLPRATQTPLIQPQDQGLQILAALLQGRR